MARRRLDTAARLGALTGASVLAAAALAQAQALGQSAAEPRPAAVSGRAVAYLSTEQEPDPFTFLTPPPEAGSPAAVADRAAFDAGRKLQGRPRWDLATSDVVQTPAAVMADFSCAMRTRLDEAHAPALSHLLTRALRDDAAAVDKAKDRFRRPRPFTVWQGAICQERTESFAKTFSYPSGHTTAGWTYALILAELAPDRADAILARGRAYGESRVVCGVHYASDVEAGRTTGAAVVAALHGDAAFRADLEEARLELAALRAGGAPAPEASQCAVQDAAGRQRPW